MRTVFFGSPPFATAVFSGLARSAHRPLAVVTGPERPAGRGRKVAPSELVTQAAALGIPVLRPANPHAPECLDALRALEPQVFAIASYGFLLKPELFELPPLGSLNVHASLLPRWRGASPIQRAIQHGDALTGVSVQKIVTKLDAGDVVCARELAIGPRATAGELLERLAPLGAAALVEALDALAAGTARFEPQDEAQVTYARKLEKDDGLVDWTRSAIELDRHVRAMTPWPAARTTDPGGRELALLEVAVLDSPTYAARPGTVIEIGERLIVATGGGALEIRVLKPAGKRAMRGAEFLRGARLTVGDRLGSA